MITDGAYIVRNSVASTKFEYHVKWQSGIVNALHNWETSLHINDPAC